MLESIRCICTGLKIVLKLHLDPKSTCKALKHLYQGLDDIRQQLLTGNHSSTPIPVLIRLQSRNPMFWEPDRNKLNSNPIALKAQKMFVLKSQCPV